MGDGVFSFLPFDFAFVHFPLRVDDSIGNETSSLSVRRIDRDESVKSRFITLFNVISPHKNVPCGDRGFLHPGLLFVPYLFFENF